MNNPAGARIVFGDPCIEWSGVERSAVYHS